jgi:hypothetical protein
MAQAAVLAAEEYTAMLEDRPILKDRLMACATFSGIAIAAVAGFDMVISGGFDFLTPGMEVREVAPSSYVTVQQVPWSPDARVIPLSSNEPFFAGEFLNIDGTERLAGGYDDASAPDTAGVNYPMPSEDQVYREIEGLYADTDFQNVDAEAEYIPAGATEYEPADYADPYVVDAAVYPDAKAQEPDASASGSASPW